METKSEKLLLIDALETLAAEPCQPAMNWLKHECKSETIEGIWSECPNGSWLVFVKVFLDEEPELKELTDILLASYQWVLDDFTVLIGEFCKEGNSPNIKILPCGKQIEELVEVGDEFPLHEYIPSEKSIGFEPYRKLLFSLQEIIVDVRMLVNFGRVLKEGGDEVIEEYFDTLVASPTSATLRLRAFSLLRKHLNPKNLANAQLSPDQEEEWFERLLAEAVRVNTKIPVIAL